MPFDCIVHGDCLEEIPRLREEFGEFVDLIVTSPPYSEQRKHAYEGIPGADYPTWMLGCAEEFMSILKPTGSFVLNIKEHAAEGVLSLYVLETVLLLAKRFRLVDEFIWCNTKPFPTGSKRRLKNGWEHCYHFAKTKDYQFFPDEVKTKSMSKWADGNISRKNKGAYNTTNKSGMGMGKRIVGDMVRPSNVLTFPSSCLNIGHPATFPIRLPEFFIRLMTRPGDLVLDPFAGSGTTALAAKGLGRRYLGIERVEEYVSLANSRL